MLTEVHEQLLEFGEVHRNPRNTDHGSELRFLAVSVGCRGVASGTAVWKLRALNCWGGKNLKMVDSCEENLDHRPTWGLRIFDQKQRNTLRGQLGPEGPTEHETEQVN